MMCTSIDEKYNKDEILGGKCLLANELECVKITEVLKELAEVYRY